VEEVPCPDGDINNQEKNNVAHYLKQQWMIQSHVLVETHYMTLLEQGSKGNARRISKGRTYPVWIREIRRDQHYVKGKNKMLEMSLEKFGPEVEGQDAMSREKKINMSFRMHGDDIRWNENNMAFLHVCLIVSNTTSGSKN